MNELESEKNKILENTNLTFIVLLIVGIVGVIISAILAILDFENTTATIVITIISCTTLIIASIESTGKIIVDKMK